jgi:hypothetical protein
VTVSPRATSVQVAAGSHNRHELNVGSRFRIRVPTCTGTPATPTDIRRHAPPATMTMQEWQHFRKISVTSRDGGIRTRGLLLPNQAQPAARRRLASPGVGFTCGNISSTSPAVAQCLCTLAPTLAPQYGTRRGMRNHRIVGRVGDGVSKSRRREAAHGAAVRRLREPGSGWFIRVLRRAACGARMDAQEPRPGSSDVSAVCADHVVPASAVLPVPATASWQRVPGLAASETPTAVQRSAGSQMSQHNRMRLV